MKRSGQIALVLMGVTGTTAAGAYMMPPRPECRAAPASTPAVPGAPSALSGDPAAAAAQPCRRRSWGSWRWSGNSHYSYSPNNTPSSSPRAWFPSTRSSNPTSTSIAPTTSGPRSTGPGTSATPRGGFGTTGHSTGS
jgi:hypothetical protein